MSVLDIIQTITNLKNKYNLDKEQLKDLLNLTIEDFEIISKQFDEINGTYNL